MRTNWLFILFAVLLYLASKANKNKNVWACWIPLGLSLVMGPFSGVLKGFSGQLSFFPNCRLRTGDENGNPFPIL